MSTSTDTDFAKKIDTELAEMASEARNLEQRRDRLIRDLLYRAGSRCQRGGRWTINLPQAINILRADPTGGFPKYPTVTHAEAIDRYEKADEAVDDAWGAFEDHEKAHYTGWSRFYLVPEGHIHSSRSCHTLRMTTALVWLPQLSGESEADAVAEQGTILCTHCFPSAPAEWTVGKVDDTSCPGSGRFYDENLPHRKGYYQGNWATCPECGGHPSLTSTMKLRKHKRDESKE